MKAAPEPRLRPDPTGFYALRPFELLDGADLSAPVEPLLARRVEANLQALIDRRDGRTAYTEDALDLPRAL